MFTSIKNRPYIISRLSSRLIYTMSKGKVLITGANGYIGAVTVGAFLDAGWSVRGTVRRLESAEPVKAALKKYVDEGKLEFVSVPDITVDGAFDEAVKGVSAIAHLASPVSMSFTDPDPVLRTAENGTKTILKSAKQFGGSQLKSFVITSSIAAIFSDNLTPPHTFDETQWNTTALDIVKEKGKETPGPVIYRASKALSERALWDFVKEEKPSFTATAVNPSWVKGPPLVLPSDPEKLPETTIDIYYLLSGKKQIQESPLVGFVDVRDVARYHVWAVENSEEANGQRYLLSAGCYIQQAMADVLRKQYPDRKIDVGNPGQGYPADFKFRREVGFNHDNSKSLKATGQEYITFEKMVLDAAKEFERFL